MRYLSLFSGIEAASVAWGPLGWEPVAFAEIEKFPSAVLAERFPQVPNLGDVTKVDWSGYRGAVDVVVGGSPCQAFSIAGNRRGLMDERGLLMLEYCRAVGEVRPRWVVWENVPGVLSQDSGRAFGTLLGELEELGYSLAWRVLDAQYFGVAQRRRRVFLVGHLGAGGGAPAAVLFEPDCLRGDNPPGRQKRQELAAAAGRGAGGSYTLKLRHTGSPNVGGGAGPLVQDDVSATLATRQDQVLFQPACIPINGMVATRGSDEGRTCMGIGDDGDPQFTVTAAHPHAVAYAVRTANASANGIGVQEEVAHALDCSGPEAVCAGFKFEAGAKASGIGWAEEQAPTVVSSKPLAAVITQYGEEVAGTLTARADSSPCADRGANVVCMAGGTARAAVDEDLAGTLHCHGDPPAVAGPGYVVRRLTPVECERLQGFPDGWTAIPWRGKSAEECPDAPRYKALGNSMAVPCMRWIGERIQTVDEMLREGAAEGGGDAQGER